MFAATPHALPATARLGTTRARAREAPAAGGRGRDLPADPAPGGNGSLDPPSELGRAPRRRPRPLGRPGHIRFRPGDERREERVDHPPPRERGAKRTGAGPAADGDRSRKAGAQDGGAADAHGRPVAKRPGVTQKPKASAPGRAPADQTAPVVEEAPPGQQSESVPRDEVQPPEVRLPTTPPPPPLPPPPFVEPILEPVRPIVDETKPIVDGVTQPIPDLNPPAIPKGLPGVGK
jgi:hypothetical protein